MQPSSSSDSPAATPSEAIAPVGADAPGAVQAAPVAAAAAAAAATVSAPAAAPPATVYAAPSHGGSWLLGAAVLSVASVAALVLAFNSQQRVKTLEQELVRRQQDSQGEAIEARALAQQAQDVARTLDSKVSLLEARVAETALQRGQLEDLIQQLSRSRDENLLADLDAALRVAQQQSALTGGLEPLAAALRQAEMRLAHAQHPRLERVRRAVARDLDRVASVSVGDLAGLTIKLDEATRSIDDLPLIAQIERRPLRADAAQARQSAAAASRAASRSASAPADVAQPLPWQRLAAQGTVLAERFWSEVQGLLRVTRIEKPEAVLIAPEQAWFLRENLKLRLLNARLALLSRQFDVVQNDLREVQAQLARYFDGSARRVALTHDLVRQVAQQARQINLPRPDETLAAIAAVQAGR